jgi:hypothetical protein
LTTAQDLHKCRADVYEYEEKEENPKNPNRYASHVAKTMTKIRSIGDITGNYLIREVLSDDLQYDANNIPFLNVSFMGFEDAPPEDHELQAIINDEVVKTFLRTHGYEHLITIYAEDSESDTTFVANQKRK